LVSIVQATIVFTILLPHLYQLPMSPRCAFNILRVSPSTMADASLYSITAVTDVVNWARFDHNNGVLFLLLDGIHPDIRMRYSS
jgi:hypothetical protein